MHFEDDFFYQTYVICKNQIYYIGDTYCCGGEGDIAGGGRGEGGDQEDGAVSDSWS